jgi:mannosyltransferase
MPMQPELIIPNLHWHYSGVTATNRMVAPLMAERIGAVWFGRDAPAGIVRLTLRDLLRLRRSPGPILWHARRNNEMIVGLVLRALGWPLRLIFTSAAQRRHRRLTRFLIAQMDVVIAASAAAASYLEREAIIVEHGIDTQRFQPAADRELAFAASGLPGHAAIGCFGRVRAQKGTDVFIEAMCRLLPRFPDFTAIVVGAETADQRSFAEGLKARVRDAGLAERIVFLGERPTEELPDWFRRILIYAFTSRTEGFGLTLLEAMASGAALVATRAGAAELTIVPGETGVLVPPGDADALTAALEPLMRDPRAAAAMGLRARDYATEHFGIGREVARILAVYRTVLARG